jgi:hypothetical protein
VLSGWTFGGDGDIDGDVCRTVGAHIASDIDAAFETAGPFGASILAARTADRSVQPAAAARGGAATPGPRSADMLDRIAVVVAGAAGVGVALEQERIGSFETTHDAHTSQDGARKGQTGGRNSVKRMCDFHQKAPTKAAPA